jgi:hypothetical protein
VRAFFALAFSRTPWTLSPAMVLSSARTIGIGLVILSALLWAAIPVTHLFPISLWWKAAIDTALLIAAEIAFWIGAAMLGAAFKEKVKRLWKPKEWFRKDVTRDS